MKVKLPSSRPSSTASRARSAARANGSTAKTRRMLINGQWVAAQSGETFATYNPATGEAICNVPAGDKADIDAAVKAARKAFESGPWHRMTPSERGRLIWKLADLLEENLEEFARIESLDNCKPLAVARVGCARRDTSRERPRAASARGPERSRLQPT